VREGRGVLGPRGRGGSGRGRAGGRTSGWYAAFLAFVSGVFAKLHIYLI
jgi:hypothetical protein